MSTHPKSGYLEVEVEDFEVPLPVKIVGCREGHGFEDVSVLLILGNSEVDITDMVVGSKAFDVLMDILIDEYWGAQ